MVLIDRVEFVSRKAAKPRRVDCKYGKNLAFVLQMVDYRCIMKFNELLKYNI
jgi:hypothetical protein